MRIVIQRVNYATVKIAGETKSSIGKGLLILLGVEEADKRSDVEWLCNKASNLRIFDDSDGRMNLSVKDINGDVMVVSQFTLFASTKKGNRPSYIRAAGHDIAIPLYEYFCDEMARVIEKPIGHGEFGKDMQISLENSGPVTIIIDSKDTE